jgi:hypothetical protein
MDYGFLDNPAFAEMLDDDALQQLRRHKAVPHAFRVDDDNRAAAAHAEARRLAALHPARAEEEAFSLEKCREKRVERGTFAIGRAETAGTHEHVARIRLHGNA